MSDPTFKTTAWTTLDKALCIAVVGIGITNVALGLWQGWIAIAVGPAYLVGLWLLRRWADRPVKRSAETHG